MNCPKCNSNKVRVVDTRQAEDATYRKRECKECEHTFYTAEFECEYNKQFELDWHKACRGYGR